MIGEDDIIVRRALGKTKTINYRDIIDVTVAEGILAKKFNCGSIFLILKQQAPGNVSMMGGGSAERLEDVPSPGQVYDLIVSRLGPFSGA